MVEELKSDNFKKEILEHKGVAIVDFWAPWCGPCKQLSPVIEKLAPQYKKIKFAKLNVDDTGDIASEFGVMGIPCVIFFRDGKEAERMVGFQGEEALKMKLNKFM